MARTCCIFIINILLIHTYAEEQLPVNGGIIYHNEFAVHIPAGDAVAKEVAAKYGYHNIGQIGSLENFYLFRHNRIHKRSPEAASDHHEDLAADPQVTWAEQQVEKRRVKRDFIIDAWDRAPLTAKRQRRQLFPGPFSNPFGRFSIFKAPSVDIRLPIRRGSRGFPDPLFHEQWYLAEGALGGHDMNVTGAWASGYTGKGVVISILDDGIQHNHPDLAQNYDPRASTDINDNDPDPMPRDNGDNKHGTRCAGEVASVAFNDFCGVGTAYNASIGGVRMLDGTVNDAVEARAISLNPDHIDIYSASWGPEDDGKTVDGPGPLAKRAFINGVLRGRHGKGSIFVWASGNGGRHTDNCNCDGYTNSIFTLSISSASQRGLKPWYLEECSSTLASTYSSGTPGLDRSVATADMDGSLRADRICTTDHTGTSASAPLAAGICALALEANPDLTWRDMQHIVVRTSRMGPLSQEPGWFVNGVGRHASHKFGYGLMDAGDMVALAEKWTTVPPQHVCQTVIDRADLTIPTIRSSSVQAEIVTDACTGTSGEVRYLEHVQAVVSLRFLPRGNINIKLISPSGTPSTLLFERPRDVLSEKFDDWPFLTVHFWGEKAAGSWKLLVTNAGSRQSSHPGVLIHWQLILHGTRENPERLRFSASNFSPSFSPSFNQFDDLIFSGSQDHRVYTALNSTPPSWGEKNLKAKVKGEQETFNAEVCHSQCLGGCSGTGPQNCKACKHFSLQNECVSHCLEGTYASEDRDCLQCHGSCAECIGPRQNQCLSCPIQSMFVAHLGICVEECPTGFFAANSSCETCSKLCAKCDSANVCLQCDHHLLLHEGFCTTACPSRTYENNSNHCDGCHSSCETCIGKKDTDCASCTAPRARWGGRCIDPCPKGTYIDQTFRHCRRCAVDCLTCDSKGCTSCEAGWTLKPGGLCEAANNCDINEYRSGMSCQPCHSSCLKCLGPNQTECLECQPPYLMLDTRCVSSCPNGYYAYKSKCLSCPDGCSSCFSYESCGECDQRFYLSDGRCLSSCGLGFFSDRGLCLKCHPSCSSCWGPRKDHCFSCSLGGVILESTCHLECPQGFYRHGETCLQCYHNCKECSGPGLTSCTSCYDSLTLNGGVCLECRMGRYYNTTLKKCANCHETCLTCSAEGANSCYACQAPLSLHPSTRTCRVCCSNGIREEEYEDCCRCDPSTGQCFGSGTTDKRRIALSLLDNIDESPSAAIFSSTTTLVVVICLVNVIIFASVFAILQVRSSKRGAKSYSYHRVPVETSPVSALTMRRLIHSEDDDSEEDECKQLVTKT